VTIQPSTLADMASRMYPNQTPDAGAQSPAAPAAEPPAPPVGRFEASHPIDLAARMYPGMVPGPGAQSPVAEGQPAKTEPAAPDAAATPAALQIPDEVRELRDADMGRRVYGVKGVFDASLPDDIYADDEGLAPDVKPVVVNELREIAADVGATNADVMSFRRVANSLTQAPTSEQRTAWHDQIVQQLNEQYGDTAAQALADAAKFARRDPRLAAMLAHNGLGDHPEIVLQFARLAREARRAGKLK